MIFKPYFGDYEVANLFRIGGPGLGNLLFPLCRSYIYSLKYGGEVLPPVWASLKPGAYLRCEKEKRGYTDVFKSNFVKRTSLQLRHIFNKSVSEDSFLKSSSEYLGTENTTIKVEGLRTFFSDLKGYHQQLLSYILTISSQHIKKMYTEFDNNSIGVHIRLGDFGEDSRTSLTWYRHTITILQRTYPDIKFIIFSDGKDEELKSILSLPNCKRVEKPNALADILCLSKCQIIIGSNSTFSAWAAFLGRKPFIRHEKFYLKQIYEPKDNLFEGHDVLAFLSNYEN